MRWKAPGEIGDDVVTVGAHEVGVEATEAISDEEGMLALSNGRKA